MRRKKRPWLRTSNIYIYLLYKSLLAFIVLLAAQAFFYLDNTRIFHVDGFHEWMGIIWGNMVFGIATIGCMLLAYYALNLIPFNFRWNPHYHRITELVFYYLPIMAMLVADICDSAYYQYTYRRLSGEIFRYLGISGNMGALWPHFVVDYWHSTLFAIIITIILFWLGGKAKLLPRNRYRKHKANDLVGLVLGGLCVVFLLRGGFGKNIEWHDTTKYCQAKNCALVTNSGYNIVRTFNGGTLQEVNYMDAREAEALYNPVFAPDSAIANARPEPSQGWAPNAGCWLQPAAPDSLGRVVREASVMRKNVVMIVLESFSQEYMGCYNKGIMPSFTPFLDSLYEHSVVYQGRANGKKSIEGIPAVFSSIPTLMTFPLSMSDYRDDSINALPNILRNNGYHTAFFHGSYNGVMNFDRLCKRLGFEEYFGKNEYMADRHSRESDYDGCWGIYDEYYLQYMVRKLSTFEQPFMSGVFTLSSHHPYTMQPGHENDFVDGPHPLCKVVMYSDNALRKFFDAARKTDWYENTIFVITADHSGQGLSREYNDYDGWYRIPMLFYIPKHEEFFVPQFGEEWSAHKVYPRLMQQIDIMPTLLDYLGIQAQTVCFGTSAFRNPEKGWQIAYGNGYYQLETNDGKVAVIGQEKEEGDGNIQLLKAIVQQYNHRLINNQLR